MSARKPPPKPEPERAGVWLGLSEEERRLFEKELAGVTLLRKGSDRVLIEAGDAGPKSPGKGAERAARDDDRLVVDRQDGRITGTGHGVS